MKSTTFNIKELVDRDVFNLLEQEAWKLFDDLLILTLDKIKDKYKWTMVVNNWFFSIPGQFSQRGYRSAKSTVGARNGAHYKGMGIDFDAYLNKVVIPPDEVRNTLIRDINLFPDIKCLETDINWVHFDIMERFGVPKNEILLYSPKGNTRVIKRS